MFHYYLLNIIFNLLDLLVFNLQHLVINFILIYSYQLVTNFIICIDYFILIIIKFANIGIIKYFIVNNIMELLIFYSFYTSFSFAINFLSFIVILIIDYIYFILYFVN